MKGVASMLLLLFTAVAIFGLAGMAVQGHEHCAASFIDFVVCPQNVVASVIHHSAAFEALTHAFTSAGLALLLAAFVLAFLISGVLPRAPDTSAVRLSPRASPAPAYTKLRERLALFENSPSIA